MMRPTSLVLLVAAVCLSGCGKSSPQKAQFVLPPRPASAEGSLVVVGTLHAPSGEFPANDLYEYAYVMKYTVDTVVEGSFHDSTILVAHFDPRTPRSSIQGEQRGHVGGDVDGFHEGDRHYLVLRPLDSAWTGAIEDDLPQDPAPRWWASWADRI